MKLATSYESAENVPDINVKELFTEKDGKMVFTGIEGIQTQENIDRLEEALKKERSDHGETKGKLKSFDGVDKGKYAEMQNELDILRAKAKDGGSDEETINAIVQAKLERATEQFTAENKELKERLEKEQGFRFNTELESNLMKELADKVDASFTGDSLALLKGNFKREANGEFLTKDGLGIGDAVSKFVEGRPHFAPQNVGGGATGSTSTQGEQKESEPQTMEQAVAEAWGTQN